MKPGDKVTYITAHSEPEHGIVKSLHPKLAHIVFVVFKCGGDWDHYENYTAAATDVADLGEGWL